ncbi:MAG TPA: DSD1 family PLP-dependent enzyme [Thermomicrobiales bacterium]|nr:DSD1 family PLP-dependent enzyme [Thermomicrobiales bacterium]
MLTTLVGRPLSEIDTPALVLDLDILEANIQQMASDIATRGASWRPHSKANKSPAIVHMEIAAGAIGVTCAKVGEAEVMAANGIRDILIANQVVGPIKTRRFAALASYCDLMVCVDNIENVREHQAAAKAAGTRPRILIEVNTGMERCGIMPGQAAVDMARFIADQPDLQFAGFMTWEGHAMAIADPAAREAEIRASIGRLLETVEATRATGLPVDIVSTGGTGTYLTSAGIDGVTEVEAGGGIFGDIAYRNLGVQVQPALTVMTQVTSRPSPEKVVIDAGRKSLDPSAKQPDVRGLDRTGDISFSAEHGKFILANPSAEPKIGDRLFLESGYSDQLCHLHDCFIGIRGETVHAIWPILGRGRLQ